MDNKMVLFEKSLPQKIQNKFFDLLSEAGLKKLQAIFDEYESETDAITFHHCLLAIRDLVQYANKLSLDTNSGKFLLIKDELQIRINEVCNILHRFRRKETTYPLTNNNQRIAKEITEELNIMFEGRISNNVEDVILLLLESNQ